METLNQVIEFQKQGMNDGEIYQRLRNMGISPREIQDSIAQAKIKNAVYEQESQMSSGQIPATEYNQQYPPESPEQSYPQEEPQEQPLQAPTYEEQPQAQEYQDNYYTQSPQAYQEQNYYPSQNTSNSETISEIAEQIVTEKISELRKETGDISSFKTKIQDKVSDIDERLKRIENSIDKLQQAVIGKIGEFGENTEMIQKNLENLHGTVSKLMNPLIDNFNELKKIAAR
jgi:hypothetical protein